MNTIPVGMNCEPGFFVWGKYILQIPKYFLKEALNACEGSKRPEIYMEEEELLK